MELENENNPELSGKYLGTITSDFIKVSDALKEGSYQLRTRGISEFPIVPICKVELPFGKLLFGRDELELEWNYYFSFIEEFAERGLIDIEKAAEFQSAYKDPDEFCCLFVVDKQMMSFLFVPYPND